MKWVMIAYFLSGGSVHAILSEQQFPSLQTCAIVATIKRQTVSVRASFVCAQVSNAHLVMPDGTTKSKDDFK